MDESITSSFVFGFLTVEPMFLYKPFKYLFGILVISKQFGGRGVHDLPDCQFKPSLDLSLLGLPPNALVYESHHVHVSEL